MINDQSPAAFFVSSTMDPLFSFKSHQLPQSVLIVDDPSQQSASELLISLMHAAERASM
jgi:hypothetical protein